MNHKPQSQLVLEEMDGTQSTPVSRTISIDNILAPEVVPDTSVPNSVQTPEPRCSGTTVKQPNRLMFLGETYEAIQEEHDSNNYKEVQANIDASHWQNAMKAEIESMHSNQVWELVDPPINVKPIGYKWIYKRKRSPCLKSKVSGEGFYSKRRD